MAEQAIMESDGSHKNDTNLMRKRPYLAVLLKDLSDGDHQAEYSEVDRASNIVDRRR